LRPDASTTSVHECPNLPCQVFYLKFTGGGHCRWCWSGAMLVMWEGEIGRA
jgi:hypothetical protein